VSNKNAQVMTVLAGAAALAGVGYALTRGAAGHSARSTRGQLAALGSASSPRAEPRAVSPEDVSREPAAHSDADRVSSAPDALDLAIGLEGIFDVEWDSGVQVSARPNEHVPAARTGDDEEAPSPDDLAQVWLAQATESERSLGTADTIPDLEDLTDPDLEDLTELAEEFGEASEANADGVEGEDDETTAEYVRRHRVSRPGISAAEAKRNA
jgi:hypothetical protein